MVEHNGAVGQRLGGDEESLAKGARRVGSKQFGELGLDAVGSDDYVSSREGEDGLVGEDREALISGGDRGVELRELEFGAKVKVR